MIPLDRRRLVGGWELARWTVTMPDGSVRDALGEGARGLLILTRDGWATITIAAAGRPPLSPARPNPATVAERAAAFDTFVNYCCRWRLVGRTVELDVRLSQNPAMEGALLVRGVSLRGRTLIFTSEEAHVGGPRLHRLQWRPAQAGPRTRRPVPNPRRGRT